MLGMSSRWWKPGAIGRWQPTSTWRDILSEVADEVGVGVDKVERVVFAYWWFVKENVGKSCLPKVRVPFLGTFRPSLKKMMSMMLRWEGVLYEKRLAYKVKMDSGDMDAVVVLHEECDKLVGMLDEYREAYIRLLEEAAHRIKKYHMRLPGYNEKALMRLKAMYPPIKILEMTLAEARELKELEEAAEEERKVRRDNMVMELLDYEARQNAYWQGVMDEDERNTMLHLRDIRVTVEKGGEVDTNSVASRELFRIFGYE